ncbi:uncharacterized protein LOC111913024 [Lactuca sativa]|uniref:uncharacterized protein LOC111913024 n=1 Tax=Lactuca sativa TaxID=4236 RepID=UPI000CD97101|nr:uncharacterized protein LOC111913024 [Lactuca sativa]
MDSTSPTPDQKNKPPVNPYQPPLPYPARARQEKNEEDYQKFLEHIKALQINIPFIEAVAQMPKYIKFLKELLTNRRKMEEVKKVVLNENCSAAMMNKLPKKKGDPGSLTLPCQFGNLATIYTLADSGASVNLMPYSFFKKLDLPKPRPICMSINLANKKVTFPRGICEDLLVKVDKFVFPVDFIVLDMEADPQVPVILGRPFLNTASAIVDMRDSKLTLRVGDKSVTFGVDKSLKHARSSDDTAFSIDRLEELLEDWKEEKPSKSTVSFEEEFVAERDLMELERLLEEADIQNTKTELKALPDHLEYAFLEDGQQQPVIIAADLAKHEKESLVGVLKKRQGAIAWKTTDIKGISPAYCSHKINLYDRSKAVVQR